MSSNAEESWELLRPEMAALMGLVTMATGHHPLSTFLAGHGSAMSQGPLGTTMSHITQGYDTTHLCHKGPHTAPLQQPKLLGF